MRRSAVILAVVVACAAVAGGDFAPSAAAAPAGRQAISEQGYADPAGDAQAGLAPDVTAVTAFDNASGALGFRIGYADRACIGTGESVAVYLDADRNPATGSSPGGFEYALLLDGSRRSATVAQWNGSSFATTSISAAAGCSSVSSPFGDSLAVVASRLGLGIGSAFDFAVQTTLTAGAQSYHDDAGPFAYTLPPPSPRPRAPRPPAPRPAAKTVESAPLLASEARYTGKSIKHVRLTATVYATMKSLGFPRRLAVACWSKQDWPSVLASAGGGGRKPGVVVLAFWFGGQPRWLHLSPTTCADVQALIDGRVPSKSGALALVTVLHETSHAYGIGNEAQANCYAVQLVYPFALGLAFSVKRAARLESLALEATRSTAPPGYWDPVRCRAGGTWDLSR
jgi:hypothetical protein